MSEINRRQRIAVVGGGVSGLGAAWQLASRHAVTLFDANQYFGGHANTTDIDTGDQKLAVDTGFIVFNDRNYPNLTALFEQLDVPVANSDMSFGVSLRNGDFEYSGTDLFGLMAQPGNLLKSAFWQMLADIKRFYAAAPGYLSQSSPTMSIGALLAEERYSEAFIEYHLMPMAAAIWSASRADIARYPAKAFIRFFKNHGLLSLNDRPQWQTVVGGSREYVSRLLNNRPIDLRLDNRIAEITRTADAVVVRDEHGHSAEFDQIVIATHANQALDLLSDRNALEDQTLGAFKYSANRAWLHRDATLMPRRRRAWSSWNYLETTSGPERELAVTYWMNRLQPLDTAEQIFVTLNPETPPKDQDTYGCFDYEHPIFTGHTDQAQRRMGELQGARRTWYCGAYLGHGFHEDGLQSGLWVADQLGAGHLLDKPCFDRLPNTFNQRCSQAA